MLKYYHSFIKRGLLSKTKNKKESSVKLILWKKLFWILFDKTSNTMSHIWKSKKL